MRQLIGFLIGIFCSLSVAAAQDLVVSDAWVRATAPGQDSGSLQFSITSAKGSRLVAASSPVAGTVELHSMTHEDGMMKMREVQAIELPAGKHVNLHDRGYHLMLIGLKAPLKEGATVPLTLNIKVANQGVVKINTSAEVKSLTATNPASDDEHHMQMQMK